MDINSVLDRLIKILLVFVICISLTIFAIFVFPPVYAYNDFSEFIAPVSSTPTDDFGVNLQFTKYGVPYNIHITSSLNDTYYFVVDVGNNSLLYFVNTAQFTLYSKSFGSSNITPNNANLDGSYNLYVLHYGQSFPIDSYTLDALVFSSLDDALASFQDFLDNPPQLSFDSTITVEPGYVAYCVCEGGSVVLNTIMPLNSNLNIAGKPKWDSMARIAFGVQRPLSGTVLTDSFGSLINWQKNGTGPSNILGMTKYAQAIYNDLPADGSFVAIYNPAYYGDDMSNPTQAPAITANFTNLGAVAKYPINTHVSYTPALGWNIQSGSDSDWDEYGIAIPTTDGAIKTTDYIMSTTSEPAIEFPDGGYNDSNSVNNDPGSVLQRIIQPIINLLKAPFEHINNLISSGSAFMREIGQFFNWLPEPVAVIIVDALIVCVVIGVLKLLF